VKFSPAKDGRLVDRNNKSKENLEKINTVTGNFQFET
jgi:hypothetical protein